MAASDAASQSNAESEAAPAAESNSALSSGDDAGRRSTADHRRHHWTTFSFFPPDATLRRQYSSSTVLLYPSRYEGFGLPPLEAMACGCPVVTTRVGAVPEFAVHGRNAMVVEPWDIESMTRTLEAVLVTPPLRAQLSAAGMETAGRYSTRIAGEAFERALVDALASTPPSGR